MTDNKKFLEVLLWHDHFVEFLTAQQNQVSLVEQCANPDDLKNSEEYIRGFRAAITFIAERVHKTTQELKTNLKNLDATVQ